MFFGRTKCDRSALSDLKTVWMPCCSEQRRRGSDTPWTYGKTALELHSATDSLVRAVLVSVIFYTKGYLCFFSPTITDRSRCLARLYRHFTKRVLLIVGGVNHTLGPEWYVLASRRHCIGGKAAICFSINWRVEKGDLAVITGTCMVKQTDRRWLFRCCWKKSTLTRFWMVKVSLI